MTIRTLSFRTSLILAGAALTASMAFADSERYDKNLGEQTQGYQNRSSGPQNSQVTSDELPDGRSAGNSTISGIMPQSGPVGGRVTIMGTHLANVTSVSFGGSKDAPFRVINDSEVSATVPDGARQGVIELTTPSGNVESMSSFQVESD
jgi:hypothetical protein